MKSFWIFFATNVVAYAAAFVCGYFVGKIKGIKETMRDVHALVDEAVAQRDMFKRMIAQVDKESKR